MRELRDERSAGRRDLFEDIPVDWDGDDTPTNPEVQLPGCRIHVEKPVDNHRYETLATPGNPDKILIVPDVHSPYVDYVAWRAMMGFARQWRPTTIKVLGDFADFYSVSFFDKDPKRASNLLEECKVANALLDELDDLGAQRKLFCEGNHEARASRYIRQRAPALEGAVTLDGLFGFQRRGWLFLPYGELARVGNLHIAHDVGKSGANAAAQAAVTVGHSICTGHTHRASLTYFGTALGERYVSATAGWLGDVAAADYANTTVKATWQHAFATATMDEVGDFALQIHPIVRGRVIGM